MTIDDIMATRMQRADNRSVRNIQGSHTKRHPTGGVRDGYILFTHRSEYKTTSYKLRKSSDKDISRNYTKENTLTKKLELIPATTRRRKFVQHAPDNGRRSGWERVVREVESPGVTGAVKKNKK